jgi:hypothetical protein
MAQETRLHAQHRVGFVQDRRDLHDVCPDEVQAGGVLVIFGGAESIGGAKNDLQARILGRLQRVVQFLQLLRAENAVRKITHVESEERKRNPLLAESAIFAVRSEANCT